MLTMADMDLEELGCFQQGRAARLPDGIISYQVGSHRKWTREGILCQHFNCT